AAEVDRKAGRAVGGASAGRRHLPGARRRTVAPRRDQVAGGQGARLAQEGPDALLHLAVRRRDALVLAQVLGPGLGGRDLADAGGVLGVAQQPPLDGAAAPAHGLELARGPHEVRGAGGVDAVLDLDEDRAGLGVRRADDAWLGPVPGGPEVLALVGREAHAR